MSYSADPDVPVLKWPAALRISSHQLHLQSLTARFVSPLSRSVQTQELPGARFRLSFSLPPMRAEQSLALRAFLAKLRGGSGRFYFRAEVTAAEIPSAGAPEIGPTAPLTVDTSLLTADRSTITIDATTIPSPYPATATGNTANPSRIVGTTAQQVGTVMLQAGKHISFDGPSGWRRLHLLVEDAVVQTGGVVNFTVEPPLREFPAAGAPLHLANPTGIFQLVDDDQGLLTRSSSRIVDGLVIDAIESHPMHL